MKEIRLPIVIGVLADTHVSQRSAPLNPRIAQILIERKVDIIFHLGDITSPDVLAILARIAPVHAVRGNRDLAFFSRLPDAIEMDLGGIRVGFTHGHGPMPHYLWDKLHYHLTGFRFERYRRLLDSIFSDVNIQLFGHTHVAFSRWINGILYFNPGAACAKSPHDPHPSMGIITLEGRDQIIAEMIKLQF